MQKRHYLYSEKSAIFSRKGRNCTQRTPSVLALVYEQNDKSERKKKKALRHV